MDPLEHLMNLREHLNARKELALGVLSAVILLCLLRIFHTFKGPAAALPNPKAFYTIDDGKTLFVDDLAKVPPFEHGGGIAVRAMVVTTDGGKHRWTQYLMKYTDDAKWQIDDAAAAGPTEAGKARLALGSAMLVKKPGEGKWVSKKDDAEFNAVCSPTPPDGAGRGSVQVVQPGPSD